jgi:hypothetical protein
VDFFCFRKRSVSTPDPPAVGEVYVLFIEKGGEELPFYVGHAASTDFKVGRAIAYLRDELGGRLL